MHNANNLKGRTGAVLTASTLTVLAAFLIFPAALMAGNTGKIVGRVVDKANGDALFGVNILVVGTTRGATTDLEGKFTIIGVPIGTYVVRASAVGYGNKEFKDVSIGADETTTLDFELTDDAVEVTGVTVTAEAQMVNSNVTSGNINVSSEAIQNIPNVKSVEDVLALQAGVVKQGNNLFLRGGRANEVQYLVDGMPTNSITGNSGELQTTTAANEQLAALYAGVQSGVVGGGSSGLAVSANSIASVSVQTSGFDADYGNAQSGIINIVTKSGSEAYSGSAQYRTDQMANTNQNEWYTAMSFGGPEPITKYLLPGLGVDIPGDLTFFLSADVSQRDGPYNYVENQFYNPIERRVEMEGFLGGLLDGIGFKYIDNQINNFTFNSKISYDAGTEQISYGYRASLASRHDYNRPWKYRADSSALGSQEAIQNNLGWTHFFGASSFLKVYIAQLDTRDGNDIAGADPSTYSPAYEGLDVDDDNFNDVSTGQRWFSSLTGQSSFRVDYNSQVHELHLLKTGLEFHYESIVTTEIVRPTAPIADSSGNSVNAPYPEKVGTDHGEYPGYGQFRNYMNNFANRGGLFIQDNIEFSGLNLHVGIRYDYFDVGRQVFDPTYVEAWEAATRLPATWAEREKSDVPGEQGKYVRLSEGGSSFPWYATNGNFSPRLSIGYPVTDRIVFYFNYGHFLQFPDRENYFLSPFDRTLDNSFVGNPDLKPQRTVAYEAGFEDQFTNDMAFAIRAFYKDIFDYVTAVDLGDAILPINFDYASARGFETTFNQSFLGNFSLNLSYTYQIAKGRSSNPFATVFNPDFSLPRETRLDWDQNHTANVFATYRVGPNEPGTLFGLPFINNYGLSVTWTFGSGFPYTPFNGGRATTRNLYLVNSETKPYTSTVNLSLYKGFKLMDKLNLMATLDITNLLNRRNVNSVLSYTGEPAVYGDIDPTDPNDNTASPWHQAEFELLDPTAFAAPRQILLGVRLNWE